MGLYKYGGEDGERFPTHKSGSATNIICVVEVETQFQVLRRFYIYTKVLYFYKDSVKGLLKRQKIQQLDDETCHIEKYPKRALIVIC